MRVKVHYSIKTGATTTKCEETIIDAPDNLDDDALNEYARKELPEHYIISRVEKI